MNVDLALVERDVCSVVRARYGWSPDIDDLLVIAREAVDAVIRSGEARTPDELKRYCLRRARCRVVDYLRRQRRTDPARCLRQPVPLRIPRAPTLPVNARLPVALKAQLAGVALSRGWTMSKTLRLALEQGLQAMECSRPLPVISSNEERL